MGKPRRTVSRSDTSGASRYVPAAIRRAVFERDGGRCRYVDARGRRCPERHRLEFHHHDLPYGLGGNHHPAGLRLMCSAHNALLADQDYGEATMAKHRGRATRTG